MFEVWLRDLKCENVLICHDERIMIGDFGFARVLDSDMVSKTFCGSAAYAAPELLKAWLYINPKYEGLKGNIDRRIKP